jgi:N6-L-threonylcarbamoyladenine synthase
VNILAIESSCDETACAVVKDGVERLADVVASSKELHELTGGVVPEVAARKQLEFVVPVIELTLRKYYGLGNEAKNDKVFREKIRTGEGIDMVAVTAGPGLIGSLIVGIEAAKALSLAWNKPLIPVNHLLGHIYANFINRQEKIEFPSVALLVSGGHTDLIFMRGHGDFEFIGGTLDDAAGEAFDKTARLLGLSKYLGGVLLSKKASECTDNTISGKLPRPMINEDNFDFSFSGLKTAVKRLVENNNYPVEVVSCEFENAVCDVLIEKTIRALKKYKAKTLLLGGGVAANKQLRTRLQKEAENIGISFFVPPIDLCTDNAVYIAGAAYFNNKAKDLGNIVAKPSLGIMDEA